MYRILKLEDELRRLQEEVKKGNATQEIINRIFEIQLVLDNIYYTDM